MLKQYNTKFTCPSTKRDRYLVFPRWAKQRQYPWVYLGYIRRETFLGKTFKERCQEAKRLDHGEIRCLDIYPEGAIEWYRPANKLTLLRRRYISIDRH